MQIEHGVANFRQFVGDLTQHLPWGVAFLT